MPERGVVDAVVGHPGSGQSRHARCRYRALRPELELVGRGGPPRLELEGQLARQPGVDQCRRVDGHVGRPQELTLGHAQVGRRGQGLDAGWVAEVLQSLEGLGRWGQGHRHRRSAGDGVDHGGQVVERPGRGWGERLERIGGQHRARGRGRGGSDRGLDGELPGEAEPLRVGGSGGVHQVRGQGAEDVPGPGVHQLETDRVHTTVGHVAVAQRGDEAPEGRGRR